MTEEIAAETLAQETPAGVETKEIENSATNQEEQPEGEQLESVQPESKADDDTPFPKKAINALSRRDKMIGKLRAENQRYNQEMAEIRKQIEELRNPAPQKPDPDNFDTYAEYIEALASYRDQPGNGVPQEQPMTKEQAIEAARREVMREQSLMQLAQKSAELAQKIPDYMEVANMYGDVMSSFPEEAQDAFTMADNGALAFYTLAKEGTLEALTEMTPIQMAMTIARAETRGQKYLKPTPSAAPPPLRGVRGASSAASDDSLSGTELLKKYGLK